MEMVQLHQKRRVRDRKRWRNAVGRKLHIDDAAQKGLHPQLAIRI